MKSEDTRNLFVAAALSLLVMIAWQYFYAGPLYQREHQAQMQANQVNDPPPASEAQPSATPGATASPPGVPASRHPAGRRRRDRAGDSQRGAGGEPPGDIDTPSVGGSIDLKGGKIDDIVLKDYRETIDPKSPNIRLVLAARRARRLLGRDGICERGRGSQDPHSRHPVDRRSPDADPIPAGDADLGQWRWPRFQARHRGRRQIHVHDHGFGRELRRRGGDGAALRAHPAPRQAERRWIFGAA